MGILRSATVPARVIYSDDSPTPEATVTAAVKAGVSLRHADLSNLDMGGVRLRLAEVFGCSFAGCKLNWNDRYVLAEILRQAAGKDLAGLQFAGFVAICADWCWDEILAAFAGNPTLEWALDEFRARVKPGDDAPDVIKGPPK